MNPHYAAQCVHSHVLFFATQGLVAHQAPLSMGIFRQEYWSGLHLPLQGIFQSRDQTRVSCRCPSLQVDSLPLSHQVQIIEMCQNKNGRKEALLKRMWYKGAQTEWVSHIYLSSCILYSAAFSLFWKTCFGKMCLWITANFPL